MVSAPALPNIKSLRAVPDMVSAIEVPMQVVLTTHWMLAASATPPATNTIRAMVETTTTMRLIRVLPFHEGRGDLPRPLANVTTVATIGTRRITQLQYLLQLSSPTAENSHSTHSGE